MAVKDMEGNEVVVPREIKPALAFLAFALAAVLVACLFGYRAYDCSNFNHRNEQRLRNLENYGAAATLRDNRRDWKYPWLVKDTSPVKLIFFDHPRFADKHWTDVDIDRVAQLIGGLPNVESILVARKNVSAEIIKQLEKRLDGIEFTLERTR